MGRDSHHAKPRADSTEWPVFLRQQVLLPDGEPGWPWCTGTKPPRG